jgi:hypothetical protein
MLSALRDTALFFFDLSMSVVQCLLGSPGLLPVRPQMGHGALCCAYVGASRLAKRLASHDFTAAGVTTPFDEIPQQQPFGLNPAHDLRFLSRLSASDEAQSGRPTA